jgi:hypothetical protein
MFLWMIVVRIVVLVAKILSKLRKSHVVVIVVVVAKMFK